MACDSGSKGPYKEPGPVPLSAPNAPITRLVKTKATFEVTYRDVFWDEGSGPVLVQERARPVVDAVPKELMDHLRATRNVPCQNGPGRFDQTVYSAWGVVVSLKPDVLIVTVREEPEGSYDYEFKDWNELSPRWGYICQHLERIRVNGERSNGELGMMHAGTLVPWSNEMYLISTDPKVEYRRLKFDNNLAVIVLPGGKLALHHHDDDVDVSRE